jgi:hypothetical protein
MLVVEKDRQEVTLPNGRAVSNGQGMSAYPRVCRNGHTILGPKDEHIGEHRQCRRCRWDTQRDAQDRYRNSLKGMRTDLRSRVRERGFADARDEAALAALPNITFYPDGRIEYAL